MQHYAAHGPLVKWLRHRPFTAVTRVRVSYGVDANEATPYGGIAQLVERPPHTRKVTDSSSVVSTTKTPEIFGFWVFLLYIHNNFDHLTLPSPKHPELKRHVIPILSLLNRRIRLERGPFYVLQLYVYTP